MRKKTLKAAAAATLAGMLFQFGGCLGGGGQWGRFLWDGALYAGWEFLLDNDGLFDLFEDGEPTPAAQ